MVTVAIVGVGMMGGSLGRALRRRGKSYRVTGIGRDKSRLAAAKKIGACDEVSTDLSQGVQSADIVVLCTPVDRIAPTAIKILPSLKPGAVVTDIGSVKAPILESLDSKFSASQNVFFIGAHPLAGSEKTGPQNSNPDLYEGATTVLCPLDGIPAAKLRLVKDLWRAAGSETVEMAPEIHDLLVAQTSHLPHVLSGALVQMIEGLSRRDKNTPKLLAGSFRDMTRISDSLPEQWAEICGLNRKYVIGALKSYRDILNRIIREAEGSGADWLPFFERSSKARASLFSKKLRP